MARITEVTGSRVYVETRYGEPCVAKLKSLGAHWDKDRRQWWIGRAKQSEVEQLLKAEGAGFDLRNPTDRAVRADQLEEAGKTEEADALRKPAPQQDPDDIRLSGKGEYKGKTYYLGSRTKDGTRVRCLTLPDREGKYLDFWAPVAEVKVIKTYQAREVWDGRRYSNRTVTQYTTLGSIAKFLAREQRNRAEGGVVCAECGKSGELILDHEDGLMKHRRCCDMPSE